MTMFEVVIMAPLLATLLFLEMYRADPRALLHKPTDESPFFVGIFVEPSDEKESPKKPKKWGKKNKGRPVKVSSVGITDSGTKGKQLD